MQVVRSRTSLRFALLCLPLLIPSFGFAQDHIQTGELKGFTRSPEEHIINRIDTPFAVREVKGTALLGDGEPAAGMLLELRGPNDAMSILSTKTKPTGEFHLKHVRPGNYLFKATLPGFQSVVGTIIVSPKATGSQVITIQMKPGV